MASLPSDAAAATTVMRPSSQPAEAERHTALRKSAEDQRAPVRREGRQAQADLDG